MYVDTIINILYQKEIDHQTNSLLRIVIYGLFLKQIFL